ncbi:MAG: cellulase family glycosylhydrolase, partial [Acidimicrobiia bacterium]|nr:cellulase family glycosylhydrolase [Acidimicrobiia bacterium]
ESSGTEPSTSTTVHHPPAPPTTKASPPAARPRVQGPLRAVGNTIVDANGHPVVLRGIERVGFQVPGQWPAITDAEMAHAQQWGANVVRLPMGEAPLDPTCTSQYVPNYLDTLDGVVNSITTRGMVAILDLSFDTRTHCGKSFRWKMADTWSIPFWQTVAAHYKTNPLVVFDLYNEPYGITPDQWRDGGQIFDGTTGVPQWTAVGMQDLYDAVRSTGAENVVTISGSGYGGSAEPILDGHAIRGDNIVYAAHAYTCSDPDSASVCTSFPANRQEQLEPQWQAVGQHHPVMITEFGWPDPGDGTYNASVIRFAQAQNPPWGWVAFGWDGTTTSKFGLVADLSSYAPTPSGAPVKNALLAPP